MPTIATWNVNSIRARLDHVSDWLQANPVDLLALQETKVQDDDFPHQRFAALGYQLACVGQKSYNGVAVLARRPLAVLARQLPGFDDDQARLLAVEHAGMLVVDVYVPNGASVGSDKYAYKLAWLDALAAWLETLLAQYDEVLVAGDFNIAPGDADVHDPQAWDEKILCSTPERERLARLQALGLSDAFRAFAQAPASFSWWDYRAAGFRRNRGLRIDLILVSAALAARLRACHIDVGPRGLDKPSDHAPVIAEFAS
ncbi:MAG: exodeoxyribonuclease III [Gammaproteobacteria bacterium]|nr:exodeoxyribonuclease III [Gammaproteobacteria bacterium]